MQTGIASPHTPPNLIRQVDKDFFVVDGEWEEKDSPMNSDNFWRRHDKICWCLAYPELYIIIYI